MAQGTADEERLDKVSSSLVGEALDKAQADELLAKSVQAVVEHALDRVDDPSELVVDYMQESGSELCESSDEAFEIQYEFIGREEVRGALLRKAESELDISNLELRIYQVSGDGAASPLARILDDIEREIVEKRGIGALVVGACNDRTEGFLVDEGRGEMFLHGLLEIDRASSECGDEEDGCGEVLGSVEPAKLPGSISWPLLKSIKGYDLDGLAQNGGERGLDGEESARNAGKIGAIVFKIGGCLNSDMASN